MAIDNEVQLTGQSTSLVKFMDRYVPLIIGAILLLMAFPTLFQFTKNTIEEGSSIGGVIVGIIFVLSSLSFFISGIISFWRKIDNRGASVLGIIMFVIMVLISLSIILIEDELLAGLISVVLMIPFFVLVIGLFVLSIKNIFRALRQKNS